MIGGGGARRGRPAAPGAVGRGAERPEQAADTVGGRTPGGARGSATTGGRAQFQPNRSDGGGRGAGTAVGSPRWLRIRRMTRGSSMVATTRIRPPQRVHANTSTANV